MSQKSSKKVKVKQVKISYNIGENDLNIKLKQIHKFLNQGKPVKLIFKVNTRDVRVSNITDENIIEKLSDIIKDFKKAGSISLKSNPNRTNITASIYLKLK